MTAAARNRPATADKTWKTAAPGLCTVSGAVGNQNQPAPRNPGPAATPDGTRTAADSYNWSGLEANGNTSANLQAYAYSEIDSEWFEPHSSEALTESWLARVSDPRTDDDLRRALAPLWRPKPAVPSDAR